MTNEIERLKSVGQYYQAGALAASLGQDDNYGCHYGMRSERENAVAQYRLGHAEALAALANTTKR